MPNCTGTTSSRSAYASTSQRGSAPLQHGLPPELQSRLQPTPASADAALVLRLQFTGSDTLARDTAPALVLTSATVLTASRGGAGSFDTYVSWLILERW